MPQNDYLAWAVGGGANVENAAAFAADPDLSAGFVAGRGRSAAANTLWRQHSVAIAAIAQFMVDTLGLDILDDGSVTNFKTHFIAALAGAGISPAAAADIWAGTNNAKFISALTMKNAMVFQSLTYASTVAWNAATQGFNTKLLMTGNAILGAPTNLQEGEPVVLAVTQDGTGSRLLTYAACWDFQAVGVPALSTGAGKTDMIYGLVLNASTPVIKASFVASA